MQVCVFYLPVECRLLHTYQRKLCCFNDDIQGTACVCLAALLSAARVSKVEMKDQRVLFLGAGEAGVGIGELIAMALESYLGISREEARKRCLFMDSKVSPEQSTWPIFTFPPDFSMVCS